MFSKFNLICMNSCFKYSSNITKGILLHAIVLQIMFQQIFIFFLTGIKICGGCSQDGREVNGIFIKRILPGGLADQDGKFF